MKGKVVIATVLAVGLAGCSADDPHRRAKTGAAVGAVAGAVVGKQAQGDKGALVGAAVGALAGAAVGNYMDEQQRALERELEEERRQNALEVERLKNDTLRIDVQGEVLFDFDKAAIKPAFHQPLGKIAGIIQRYEKTVVHVVGHTDSVGPEGYNLTLSRQRADSVANYLVTQGVPRTRVNTVGRGETDPRATNETASGRQLNRRVEIYVKPIVEGKEALAYEPPPPGSYK